MDGRRSRWLAFDSTFYDGSVGVMLRERYGPVGLVLFSAFLCACKRNSTPGRIEYTNEVDLLNLLGLPGLELVDEGGRPFTLQSFWRSLADHKQIRKSTRGRRTQVESSRWERWQKDFDSQNRAAKSRRSRRINTGTVDDTIDARSGHDPGTDNYIDNDTTTTVVATTENVAAGRTKIAQAVVKDWYDSKKPNKPPQTFIAVQKLAERLLDAGYSAEAVRRALDRSPAITLAALQFELNGGRDRIGNVESSWEAIREGAGT